MKTLGTGYKQSIEKEEEGHVNQFESEEVLKNEELDFHNPKASPPFLPYTNKETGSMISLQ